MRTLEQQNKLLETEIEALKGRYVKPSGLRMMYEEQLRELRRVADQMRAQRVSREHKMKTLFSANKLLFKLLRSNNTQLFPEGPCYRC